MKISKNFTLKELTKSSTGERLGIDNSVKDQETLVNLCALTHNVLQNIREEHGRTTVNSSFRCLELNRAIKSSDKSQHVKGEAADIECPAIDNFQLAKWIASNLDFDQVLLEFYTKGIPDSGWVHVSYKADGNNREKELTAVKVKGKTVYKEGLIG
tara:strand:- start:723 stop:1190 length:468 start_codon:yes stop_codon:yes gene_type:complete